MTKNLYTTPSELNAGNIHNYLIGRKYLLRFCLLPMLKNLKDENESFEYLIYTTVLFQ